MTHPLHSTPALIRLIAGLPLPDDEHGSFPTKAIQRMRDCGLLTALRPDERNEAGLLSAERIGELRSLLEAVGRRSLVLGRIYEGHVNALALIERYAARNVRDRWFSDAEAGHLFGVWNTDGDTAVSVDGDAGARRLAGSKRLASGAGHVTRPLITARVRDEHSLMLVVSLEPSWRSNVSSWRAHGMRATATGEVDFAGLEVTAENQIGGPDDYLRQPSFSCGAWRFLAVQTGGIAAVVEQHCDHLRKTGRGRDPYQLARLGEATRAFETARLFVDRAARRAASAETAPEAAIAYVNLARGAVEQAGLDVITLAQRSVGLAGFMERHPLERSMRDLATYLRQPAPDLALASAAGYVLDASADLYHLWPDN